MTQFLEATTNAKTGGDNPRALRVQEVPDKRIPPRCLADRGHEGEANKNQCTMLTGMSSRYLVYIDYFTPCIIRIAWICPIKEVINEANFRSTIVNDREAS